MITIQSLQERLVGKSPLDAEPIKNMIEFMELHGIEQAAVIGGEIAEGVELPLAGQTITIPKGTRITVYGPNKTNKVTKRANNVQIKRVSKSGGFYRERDELIEVAIEIKWAGAGGYWHHVTVRDWLAAGGTSSPLESSPKGSQSPNQA